MEVDVIDAWVLKQPHDTKRSPWAPGMNIQGLDITGCAATQRPLHAYHKAWIDKMVQETGGFVVMYQTGNESNVCNSTREWEEEVRNEIKTALQRHGLFSHPVGIANPATGAVADYETWHGFGVPPVHQGPVLVNETDNRDHLPEAYMGTIGDVQASGNEMIYWRGPHGDVEFNRMLSLLGGEPAPECTTGYPTGATIDVRCAGGTDCGIPDPPGWAKGDVTPVPLRFAQWPDHWKVILDMSYYRGSPGNKIHKYLDAANTVLNPCYPGPVLEWRQEEKVHNCGDAVCLLDCQSPPWSFETHGLRCQGGHTGKWRLTAMASGGISTFAEVEVR
jgi:hypothetical protein